MYDKVYVFLNEQWWEFNKYPKLRVDIVFFYLNWLPIRFIELFVYKLIIKFL